MNGDEELSANALREITRVRAENAELRQRLTDCKAELGHAYRKLAALRDDDIHDPLLPTRPGDNPTDPTRRI
jgi:hypothetical protein